MVDIFTVLGHLLNYFASIPESTLIFGLLYGAVIIFLIFCACYFNKLVLHPKKTKTAPIKDVIAELLINKKANKSTNGICVSLIGNWGVGKTYRWEKSIKKDLENNGFKWIYISCFGKNELCDIKLELLYQIIKTKHPVIQFIIGFCLAIIFYILTCGIIFNMNGWTFSFSASLIIFALYCVLVGFLYDTLVKYLANKFIGVDNNNIDFSNFYKNNLVLCFDDIERITINKNDIGILGFFENLKNLGFPILLILNPKIFTAKSEEWEQFEEKVIDRPFIQEGTDSTFNSILSDYELNDNEQRYIKTVYNNFLQFNNEKAEYEEPDAEFVESHIQYNFRLIKKILDNIVFIRKHVKNYQDLDPNMSDALLSYIGLYTIIYWLYIPEKHIFKLRKYKEDAIKNSTELGAFYDRDIYEDIFEAEHKIMNKSAKKHFGNVVVLENPINYEQFQPVKQLLKTLECENENIDIELISTPTEKLIQGFDIFYSRTPEIKKKFHELHNSIITEEEPFSSLSSMGNILRTYCYLYEYSKHKFKETDFTEIVGKIKSFIQNKKLPLSDFVDMHHNLISVRTADHDTEFYKAAQYLNSQFKLLGKKQSKTQYNSNEDFFNTYLNSPHNDYDSLLFLSILGTDPKRRQELAKLKTTQYDTYIHILGHLMADWQTWRNSYKEELGFTKDNQQKLKQWISNEIKSLTALPGAGKAERITQEGLQEQFNKIP